MLRPRIWRCTRCWVRVPVSPLTRRPRLFFSSDVKTSETRPLAESSEEPKKAGESQKDSKAPKETKRPKKIEQPRRGLFTAVRQEISYIQEHWEKYYQDEEAPVKKKEWDAEATIQKHRNKEPVADGKSYTKLAVERQRERERRKQEEINKVPSEEDDEAEKKEEDATGEPKVFYAPMIVEAKTTTWDKRINALKDRFWNSESYRKLLRTKREIEQSDNVLAEQARKITDAAQNWRDNYETSQNPLLWKFRDAMDKVTEESDVGMAFGKLLKEDPEFDTVIFLQHLKFYMIPVVLERFLAEDAEFMELVTEEDALRDSRLHIQVRRQGRLKLRSVLNIRGLDLITAKVQRDIPLLVVAFVCQHLQLPVNEKGEIIPDQPGNAKLYYYKWELRRDFDMEDFNWRIVHWQSGEIKSLEG